MTTDDKTPTERPAPTGTPETTGTVPGAAGDDRAGNTDPPGSSSTTTASPAAAEPIDWLKLVGRLTQIESRVGQLEGHAGGQQEQIGTLHATLLDHHTVLAQHDEQLEQLGGMVGAIHDAVVPTDAKPMRGRDHARVLPPASARVQQVGESTFTDKGRETNLLVDPTKPGQQVVTLPSGQEVEINVRRPTERPEGGVVRRRSGHSGMKRRG